MNKNKIINGWEYALTKSMSKNDKATVASMEEIRMLFDLARKGLWAEDVALPALEKTASTVQWGMTDIQDLDVVFQAADTAMKQYPAEKASSGAAQTPAFVETVAESAA